MPRLPARRELHELADVVVDAAAFFHGRDDRGEVVVEQHHRGGFLRYIGAGDTHRHADIRAFQRRRVVHAVAGHCNDMAAILERLDDVEFVFRRNAREDRNVLDHLLQVLHRHARHVLAGQNAAIIGDAQLARDLTRGQRMVTGDHDGPDTGGLALGHGRLNLGSRRVDHTDQADEDQVAL